MIEGTGCGSWTAGCTCCSVEAEAAGSPSVTSTTLRVLSAGWLAPDAVSRRLEISIALARVSICFARPASDAVIVDAWDIGLIGTYQRQS